MRCMRVAKVFKNAKIKFNPYLTIMFGIQLIVGSTSIFQLSERHNQSGKIKKDFKIKIRLKQLLNHSLLENFLSKASPIKISMIC